MQNFIVILNSSHEAMFCFEKHSFADVLQNRCSFHRKTPVLESLFNKVEEGLFLKKAATLGSYIKDLLAHIANLVLSIVVLA